MTDLELAGVALFALFIVMAFSGRPQALLTTDAIALIALTLLTFTVAAGLMLLVFVSRST